MFIKTSYESKAFKENLRRFIEVQDKENQVKKYQEFVKLNKEKHDKSNKKQRKHYQESEKSKHSTKISNESPSLSQYKRLSSAMLGLADMQSNDSPKSSNISESSSKQGTRTAFSLDEDDI